MLSLNRPINPPVLPVRMGADLPQQTIPEILGKATLYQLLQIVFPLTTAMEAEQHGHPSYAFPGA